MTIVVNVGCIEDDIMNENATCGTEKLQHRKGATVDETPVTAKVWCKPMWAKNILNVTFLRRFFLRSIASYFHLSCA
jgi:hypothetical protein